MTIRVMPSECRVRSNLLSVFNEPGKQRTVQDKALGGRPRWVSIYPLVKKIKTVNKKRIEPYKSKHSDAAELRLCLRR